MTAGLVLAVSLLHGAVAFEIEGMSTARTYEVRAVSEEALLFAPFSQSLRLTAVQGIRRGHVSFETYFRGIGDAAYEGAGFAPKLYLAHADFVKGKRHPISVRLGRQIVSSSADFFTFDGARFEYRNPAYFGVETYAGQVVDQAVFENPAAGERFVFGASVFLRGLRYTQARFGIRHIRGSSGVLREDVALDFGQRIGGRLRAYGNVNASTALLTVDDALLGSSIRLSPRGLALDVEALRFRPSFDADSIFNIFQTEGFHEGRVRLRMPVGRKAMVYGHGGLQLFDSAPGLSSVTVNAGTGTRIQLGRSFVAANVVFATGYGGDRIGGSVEGGTLTFREKLTLSGGANVVQSSSELLTGNAGLFTAVFATGRFIVNRRVEVAVTGEEQLSDVAGMRTRATAVLFVRWDSFTKAPRGGARGRRAPRRRGSR